MESIEEELLVDNVSLENHEDSVNTLTFTNSSKYIYIIFKKYQGPNYLISGGSDKNIIVWTVFSNSTNTVNAKVVKIIKTTSGNLLIIKWFLDVLDLLLLPNDKYLISSCVEGNIFLYKINWEEKKLEIVGDYNYHNKFVSSVICEPKFSNMNESAIKIATQVK